METDHDADLQPMQDAIRLDEQEPKLESKHESESELEQEAASNGTMIDSAVAQDVPVPQEDLQGPHEAEKPHAEEPCEQQVTSGPQVTLELPDRQESLDREPPQHLAEPTALLGLDAKILDSPVSTEDSSTVDADDTHRTPEHDSLVTIRLSEPPSLAVDTDMVDQDGRDATDGHVTPTASRLRSGTLASMAEEDEDGEIDALEDFQEVDWEQLQRNEDEESNGQNGDNTAMLLARLEQENAKLETNPKSVKVHGPEVQVSSKRPRPPSMAQLRDMVEAPVPPALRYSMLPPPPMTDLEFYAALVQDYQQTAARLPTLLANKVRKGIPPPLRGVVWQGMSGVSQDPHLGGIFDQLCEATSPYEGIIGKDLGRSFPGVDMFRESDGEGQRMLGRVLKSYSLHEPSIGYCQGLALIVGPLLMHMPDREAFCVLVKLMESYDLRSSYTPELTGLHVRIHQFRELLAVTLPELSSHLDDLQVEPAVYVSQWFLSFFAVTCPLPMLFRMYDVLFAEGAVETIMRVALSLMHKNQERLLACSELEDAVTLLLSRGLWECYHYNADDFVLHFLGLSTAVTRDKLDALERSYHEAKIATINQTASANVDQSSSATATTASRFLGRLWVSSSSSSQSSTSSPSSVTPTRSSSLNTANSPLPSSSTLQPGSSSGLSALPLRPLSMLRRSASKQSIASASNSMEVTPSNTGPTSSSSSTSSSASLLSTTSTDATSVSHDSVTEVKGAASLRGTSHNSGGKNLDNARYLNSQIEDLLTALSDLQRQNTLVSDQLEREREERNEDGKAVRNLLERLRQKATEQDTPAAEEQVAYYDYYRQEYVMPEPTTVSEPAVSQEELSQLLETVENRFNSAADKRRSSMAQTRSQLRDELARAKEQLANELANEVAKDQDHSRQVYELGQELASMKEQLRDSHSHARTLHQDKQRLERQLHDMRTKVASESASAAAAATTAGPGAHGGSADTASDWFGRTTNVTHGSSPGNNPGNGGLRELRLGRSKSASQNGPAPVQNSQLSVHPGVNKRSSSLLMRAPTGISSGRDSIIGMMPAAIPPAAGGGNAEQQDTLVVELVQAKTAEAVARQEAEEAKQKLETLRKAMGLSSNDMASMLQSAASGSTAASGATNLTSHGPEVGAGHGNPGKVGHAPTASSSSGYGFFSGWRR